MVSAAKLKKSQDEILKTRPYVKELNNIVDSLGAGKLLENNHFFIEPESPKILVIVLGSNRGLCGSFNLNVIKKTLSFVVEQFYKDLETGNVDFLAIGKQIESELKDAGISTIDNLHDLVERNCDYEQVTKLSVRLMDWFTSGKYHRIYFVYNQFKNAAVQIPTVEQFLPIQLSEKSDSSINSDNYIFEPSMSMIVESLVPKMLKMNVYNVLMNSVTAEHGARMTSMHQATDNATDLIAELKTTYNNARQSAITNEIVEITAGAEALKSSRD